MKYKKEVIVLKDKWNPSAYEVPEARTLEMTQVAPNVYMDPPFPLDLDTQKRLLELIYSRKSGIITRQELINVLYNTQSVRKGPIIRCGL
jgi:16S rRNA G966 N2-methylase RsmD